MRFFVIFMVFIFSLKSFALDFRQDRVIIKYKNNISSQSLKGQTLRDFRDLNIKVVKLPKGMSVSDAIAYYKSVEGVEYVEPDYIIKKMDTIPTDTYYPDQWGMKKIGMEKAWDLHKGSKSITVAVIDTGVDLNHEDLKGNLWKNLNEICDDGVDNDNNGFVDDCYGWNFVANNNNPQDDDGHGTHIAGIIGAVTNNNKGVAGVNWYVNIMPIKVLDSNGRGDLSSYINGIYYAVKNGAKVINSSLGMPSNCSVIPEPASLKDAINYANKNGVLVVVASGNYGCNNDNTPIYPASIKLPNVISVGSSSIRDNLSFFSGYGVKSVHITAPGESIYSTYLNNIYKSISGTSMATPFVAGSVALLMAYKTDLNYLQVKEQILSSVDFVDSLSDKIITSGRLNVYNALTFPLKPVRPTGLTVSLNQLSATLNWQDNSNIETGFVIERNDGAGWKTIATVGSNQTTYTDNSLEYGKSYTYRVKSVYNDQYSIYSNEFAISTPQPQSSSSNTPSSSSGGGGCSTSKGNNLPYFLFAILLIFMRSLRFERVEK